MIRRGLVSVSFRKLLPEQIIKAVKASGLSEIEWGGDIHVPPENITLAQSVGKMTERAGLSVSSYGSYYRVGVSEKYETDEFKRVLNTAKCLKAPVIRVWAYNKNFEEAAREEYLTFVAQCRKISKLCEEAKISLAFECHEGTFTNKYMNTLKILGDIGCENVGTYWQPNQFQSNSYNLEAAEALADITFNVHVFHWTKDIRLPLNDGLDIWKRYAGIFKATGRDYGFHLEFMHDDSLASLESTVKVLDEILADN